MSSRSAELHAWRLLVDERWIPAAISIEHARHTRTPAGARNVRLRRLHLRRRPGASEAGVDLGRPRRRALGSVRRAQRPAERPSALRRGTFAPGGARSNVMPVRAVLASLAPPATGGLLDPAEHGCGRHGTADGRIRASAALEPLRPPRGAQRGTRAAGAHVGEAGRGARLHCGQAHRPSSGHAHRHGVGHPGHAVAREASRCVHSSCAMVRRRRFPESQRCAGS